MLDLGALGVGREGEDEQAAAQVGRPARRGLERSGAEIRGDGECVGLERAAEVGVGVSVHRRADVSALDVGDDGNLGVTAGAQRLLQRGDPRRPVPLVKGRLRLECRGAVVQRVDGAQ